jgi:hypothetical protein
MKPASTEASRSLPRVASQHTARTAAIPVASLTLRAARIHNNGADPTSSVVRSARAGGQLSCFMIVHTHRIEMAPAINERAVRPAGSCPAN